MLLNEMFSAQEARHDPKQDNSVVRLKDLRKTRLTLMQISRLRMMNDVRKFEQESKIKDIQKQYKAAAAAPAA